MASEPVIVGCDFYCEHGAPPDMCPHCLRAQLAAAQEARAAAEKDTQSVRTHLHEQFRALCDAMFPGACTDGTGWKHIIERARVLAAAEKERDLSRGAWKKLSEAYNAAEARAAKAEGEAKVKDAALLEAANALDDAAQEQGDRQLSAFYAREAAHARVALSAAPSAPQAPASAGEAPPAAATPPVTWKDGPVLRAPPGLVAAPVIPPAAEAQCGVKRGMWVDEHGLLHESGCVHDPQAQAKETP